MTEIDTFLEEVYRLVGGDQAGFHVFDFMDRLLCDGRFEVCDAVLQRVDVNRLSTSVMRSFLVITAAAREHLPSRPALYTAIESKMTELRGEDTTRKLIGNLI